MNCRSQVMRTRLVLLLAVLVFDPLRCTTPQTAALAAQFPPAIVITEGKTAQGYPYLTGGVGSDERIALEERGKDFNVKFVFAESDGSFIAAVTVEIVGAKNEPIASLSTTGPWFYIQLPPGIYHVKATFAGQVKEAKGLRVSQDKRLQRVFVWAQARGNSPAPQSDAGAR
jgi:hypothetical protein